jgi:hypothetical protein
MVRRQNLLSLERQPAAELELPAHPQPRRCRQRRARRDGRLQMPADHLGQPGQLGLGEHRRRGRPSQLPIDVGRNQHSHARPPALPPIYLPWASPGRPNGPARTRQGPPGQGPFGRCRLRSDSGWSTTSSRTNPKEVHIIRLAALERTKELLTPSSPNCCQRPGWEPSCSHGPLPRLSLPTGCRRMTR